MKVRVVTELPAGQWTTIQMVTKELRSSLNPPPIEAEFSAAAGSLLYERADATLVVGLGPASELKASVARTAAGAAGVRLRKLSARRVLLNAQEWSEVVGAAVEGLLLGNYRYEEFLPQKTQAIQELVVLVKKGDASGAKLAVRRAEILSGATNAARDVGNTPGNLLYPETLAAACLKLAKESGLKCTVLDEKGLKTGKFNGVLAVGKGSARGPRVIVLEHRGGRKGDAPLALVGKAITFDTGGISIKPAGGMEEMIFDKCGGIAVLGAMRALAELEVPHNVVGILAAAENMPSGTAYRPGDIVTMRSGVTVEIVNTDAEGRMVLGDALHMAAQDFKAKKIIDLATLTGACGVALGEAAAGLWGNQTDFKEEVGRAAADAGEQVWPMPSYPEYSDKIRSTVAQIKNSGGRLGGACTAAAFLQVFVDKTPWVHIDIAYTAHQEKEARGLASGATGFGVRTLVTLAGG